MVDGEPAEPTTARGLRAAWRWLRARLARGAFAWRRSLRVRVSVSTIAVGLVALVGLGAVLSGQVRETLYDRRIDEALTDAAARAASAQSLFDGASVETGQDVENLASGVLNRLQTGSTSSAGALLLPSPGTGTVGPFLSLATDGASAEFVSDELRAQVQETGTQHYQPTAVGQGEDEAPGVVVGTAVTIPLTGDFELYLVYSLADEQATLALLQQVLTVGALALVLLLLAMTWYLTRQVLTPVEQAARTAKRLAEGHLDERMGERGDDELAVLARSFNEMARSLQDQIERLAELSRVQQRFVSDVSHELRTPLTTIRMASEVLHTARDAMPTTAARSAELLAAQLDRFESLLADLLEISRFDAGAATLDAEEVDVHDVVHRVVELAGPVAAQRGTALQLDLGEEPVLADLDSRRIERVVRNLLVNAVEHGEGKPVRVQVGADDRAVSVVVRDHGIGMTQVQAERVFDRFWRADPARKRTLGGTGLGLAISLEDAHLHGGTLQAWGAPGEGAVFRLTLPRRAGLRILDHPLPLRPQRREAEPRHPDDPAGPGALPQDLMTEVSP